MAVYCTWEAYQKTGGTLDQASFDFWAEQASGLIDRLTMGRARPRLALFPEPLTGQLASACAQMADLLQANSAGLRRAASGIIDGPLIVAAFQSAYGLDLTDPCTTIHWWRFQALLQGLPDECRFCRVIGWRTADLSGLKGKQLAFYSDMKRKFALPADLGGEKQVYATKADWDSAFIARLKRQAGKK